MQLTVRVALEKSVHFIAVWGLDLTFSLTKYAYLVIEFNLQILYVILKTQVIPVPLYTTTQKTFYL